MPADDTAPAWGAGAVTWPDAVAIDGEQPDDPADIRRPEGGHDRSRFAWCITGSGHLLEESLALAARLPQVDLLMSMAGEEVLQIYGYKLEDLRQRFRVIRDKSASGAPVGQLYEGTYHTVVVAPATSNTVAKCAAGISDTLPSNMVAQAGKLGIPSIVFACDSAPVVITRGPRDWFELRPRNIEHRQIAALREIDHTQVPLTLAELEAALAERLTARGLAWRD
jgi:dihydromethanopterin reductase (acceptor)